MNGAPSVLTSIMRQVISIVGRSSNQPFEMPKEHSSIRKYKRLHHLTKGLGTL